MHISFYTASVLNAVRGHPMEHYRTTETPIPLRVCISLICLAGCMSGVVTPPRNHPGGHIKAHHAILKMK